MTFLDAVLLALGVGLAASLLVAFLCWLDSDKEFLEWWGRRPRWRDFR